MNLFIKSVTSNDKILLSEVTCISGEVNHISGFVAFISHYAFIPVSPTPLVPAQCVREQDVRHCAMAKCSSDRNLPTETLAY